MGDYVIGIFAKSTVLDALLVWSFLEFWQKNFCFLKMSPPARHATAWVGLTQSLNNLQLSCRPFSEWGDFLLSSFGGVPAENSVKLENSMFFGILSTVNSWKWFVWYHFERWLNFVRPMEKNAGQLIFQIFLAVFRCKWWFSISFSENLCHLTGLYMF